MAQVHSGIIDNQRTRTQVVPPASPVFECGDLCRQIQHYWDDLRPAEGLPSFQDLNPAQLPPSILPNLILLEPRREPDTSRLRFWLRLVGTALVDAYKHEITGRFLDEVYIAEDYDDTEKQFETMLETARPTCMWSATHTNDGRFMNYERILLPFAGNGRDIDMILSSVEFFPADHRFDGIHWRQPPLEQRLTVR